MTEMIYSAPSELPTCVQKHVEMGDKN